MDRMDIIQSYYTHPNTPIDPDLYPNDYMVQYYAGLQAKSNHHTDQAIRCFKKAIELKDTFTWPLFELASLEPSDFTTCHLKNLLDKETLDPNSLKGDILYQEHDQLKIRALLQAPEQIPSFKVLVQGWFDIPHSYAVVALNHVACLIEQGVDVYLEQVPYHNPSWTPTDLYNIIGYEAAQHVKKAKTLENQQPDVILRLAINDQEIHISNIPLVLFFTSETQQLTPNHIELFKKHPTIIPITPSHWSKASHRRHGLKQIPYVIKHGVDPFVFTGRQTMNTNGCTFLHIGAMTGNKNVGGILKAFYDLVLAGENIFLVLKGLADLYNGQQKLIYTLQELVTNGKIDSDIWEEKVKPRVKVCFDSMQPADLAELYKSCDVYISPYLAEGFNLPVLEALACGLLVVTTGAGPVVEWNIPEENRIFIPGTYITTDIGRIFQIQDQDITTAMAEAIRRPKNITPYSFTWHDSTKELIAVLKQHVHYFTGEKLFHQLQHKSSKRIPIVIQKGDAPIPILPSKHILVLHNSDENISEITDSNVVACFAQNPVVYHPKLHALPIGIANSQWPHGDLTILHQVRQENIPKSNLCYVGFTIETNPTLRQPCADALTHFQWQSQKPFSQYLRHLKSFQYCVCPEGNGADTHRFWECLYLGVTPIVLKNSNIIKYHWGKKLPILAVNKWSDITAEFLQQQATPPPTPNYLLDIQHYLSWIEHTSKTHVPVVLIHLGEEVPIYIITCIKQAQQHCSQVYLYLDCSSVPNWIHATNVTLLRPSKINTHTNAYQRFLTQHQICLDTELQQFRDGFWRKCIERFFILYEIMKEHGLTNVIHLENDVMLYQNVYELMKVFEDVDIATVFINHVRCVPGFFYVKDADCLQHMCDYIATLHKNDMDSIGDYANAFPERVYRLPRLPDEMGDVPCLFDAAPLGQFLGGTDPRNKDGGPGFINQDADYRVNEWTIQWHPDGPYYGYYKIGMLHIHSKKLDGFITSQSKSKYTFSELSCVVNVRNVA